MVELGFVYMATIEPITFTLKDKTKIILRNASEEDASALLELADHLFKDGVGQVVEPGELKMTLEDEKKWIQEMNQAVTSFLLIAAHEGDVVGILDFHGGKRKRIAHTGWFGMGIRRDFRNRGLGKGLLQALVQWGKHHSVIEKINLRVLANNLPAIALYSSLGFKEDGRKSKEIKIDEEYLDDISMELVL